MAKLDAKRRGGQRSSVDLSTRLPGFDDLSFVTRIVLFADGGIAQI